MSSPRGSLSRRVLSGSAYSIVASGVTLCLGLVRSILLARLLFPTDYGTVGLALLFIGWGAQLRGLGLDSALIHRQDADEALLGTYFSLRLGLDFVLVLILAGVIPILTRIYAAATGLGAVMAVLLGAHLLSNLSQVQETFMRKDLAFRHLAAIDVVAAVVMTACSLGAAYAGWGVWALVVERVSGMLTRCLLSWGPLRRWRPRLGWDRGAAQWFWAYGKPTWVASNLAYLLDRFDDFWVGSALGQTELGYYGKAYDYAHYPRRVLANPLATVLRPAFARLQDRRLELSQLFYRGANIVMRTGLLIGGLLALAMPELITYVIGTKWQPMLWTFRLMLLYTALDSVLMLADHLLLAVGRPECLKKVRIRQALVFVPAVILGARWWGINGVALAADLMLLVGGSYLLGAVREAVDFSVGKLLLWPTVALCLAWGTGYWLEINPLAGPLWGLAAKVGAFVLVYLGILVLAERDSYLSGLRDLWSIIKQHRSAA